MMLDLSAIEKRCQEASPGPWTADDITEDVIPDSKEHFWENCPHGCADGDCEGHYKERACIVNGLAHVPEESDEGWYFSLPDAEFVAHAREDIPALVARVRELEAQSAVLREGLLHIEWIGMTPHVGESWGEARCPSCGLRKDFDNGHHLLDCSTRKALADGAGKALLERKSWLWTRIAELERELAIERRQAPSRGVRE